MTQTPDQRSCERPCSPTEALPSQPAAPRAEALESLPIYKLPPEEYENFWRFAEEIPESQKVANVLEALRKNRDVISR